ncbi:ferredoxin reductase (plasmid) [Cupriavidus pinatubonensis]|uniref:ferredoxin reductase n=1 Tax=Cupriavidus pinatubonensis TaxID=248026 RepID=UPI001C72F975|nr:ferredoxin reductase [Cupriavidus pinatubonensis]
MIDGLTVRDASKHDEAADIRSFELVRADGLPLPPISADSHIDVIVPGGPTRQYSLCNAPDENHRYRIAVLRDSKSRGGSAGMHDRVNVGDALTISMPRNHFALVDDATHSLFLAGSIGVTPILCMSERLARIDASFDMHYCTRSRTRTAFLDRSARALCRPGAAPPGDSVPGGRCRRTVLRVSPARYIDMRFA